MPKKQHLYYVLVPVLRNRTDTVYVAKRILCAFWCQSSSLKPSVKSVIEFMKKDIDGKQWLPDECNYRLMYVLPKSKDSDNYYAGYFRSANFANNDLDFDNIGDDGVINIKFFTLGVNNKVEGTVNFEKHFSQNIRSLVSNTDTDNIDPKELSLEADWILEDFSEDEDEEDEDENEEEEDEDEDENEEEEDEDEDENEEEEIPNTTVKVEPISKRVKVKVEPISKRVKVKVEPISKRVKVKVEPISKRVKVEPGMI